MTEGNRNFVDQVYVTDEVSSDNGQIIDIGAKAENVYFNDNITLPNKLEEYQKQLIAETDSGIKITSDNQISINLDNLQLLKIKQLTDVETVVEDILPYYEENTLYYGACQGLIANDNSPIIKLETIRTKSFFMFIENTERFIIFSSGRIWRSTVRKGFPEQEVFTLIQNSIDNVSSFSYFNNLNEFLQLTKNDKKTFSYISIKNEKNIEDGEYLSLPIGETTKILINDSGAMYISHYINNLWEEPKKIDLNAGISALETQHRTDVQGLTDKANSIVDQANTDRQNFNNSVDEINTTLDTKENVSNKVSEITHPSLDYYPDTKAVFDYVNSKLETPLADIETLKNNKVNITDFNTYKTATDKAVKDNADNIKLLDTNKANVIISNTKNKATSNVLTDSSSHNIKNLSLYGNSAQSTVPTPTAPVNIDNVTNPQIKLYRKNLFDFNSIRVYENDSASNIVVNKDNKSISFTTSETDANSGVYIRHNDYLDYKGYGIDYTKLSGKPVALSFDIQSDINCKIGILFIQLYAYNYFDITPTKQRIVVTDTVDINKLNKALCFYTNKTKANITISNIQIEVNNTATDYEDCDVNKVSADCTLCKVNNIADTLTVNADGTGYITQNLLYERLTSGASQSGHTWQYSTTSKRFYRDDTRYKANYRMPNLLCSHFEVKDNERDLTLDNSIGFTSGSGNGVAIRMLQFDGDISAFKNWLDNNEVYILIPLQQPIITELSKEQVDKILSLYTYYPSTTVVSDCDSQLTYIADTKNYIDNKFNELATALVAHESEVTQ